MMERKIFHGLNANNLVLIIIDFCVFILIASLSLFCLRLYLTEPFTTTLNVNTFVQLGVFYSAVTLCFIAVGLYNEKRRETLVSHTVRVLVALGLNYLLLSLIETVFPNLFYHASFNEIFVALSLILFTIVRLMVIKLGLDRLFSRNILILGTGESANILHHYLRSKTDLIGLNIIGFWPLSDQPYQVDACDIILSNDSLETYAEKNQIDEIVIANNKEQSPLPIAALLKLKQQGMLFISMQDFVEKETGQVVVDALNPTSFIYNQKPSNKVNDGFYWLFNFSIAAIITLFTLPIMLLTAIAIKIEGGKDSSVLYSQQRVGLNGRLFTIYKFTSMNPKAEQDGAQWAVVDDPRVTKVGRIIRKYRIDELPQLYNVIKGDMFFVGPRPERPEFTEEFNHSIPFYDQRHNVKPGLTGWAQLKYPYGSSAEDALEKLKFDLYYVKKHNFFFDILILLKTSEIVLFGKGR